MKVSRPVNLQSTLLGECVAFLTAEEMPCLATQEGLTELISKLAYYKEEGKSLYPEIYIFDDLETVKGALPNSQFCFVGQGAKSKESMLRALKKCAPLTENGWSIYILRKSSTFEFGVFRAGTSILSVSISETLMGNEFGAFRAILIHQIVDKIIEVRGTKADTLIISFGSPENANESPTANQNKFVDAITKNIEDSLMEPSKNFFKKIFLHVLQTGHGTLACVVKSKRKLPKKLEDGVILSQKIDISRSIKEVLTKNDLAANSILEGQFSLLSGMMQSDGITVFTDTGEIAAYNVFIKHPEKIQNSKTTGGARSRTYLTLCDQIGRGIESAYIQSQDGKIEYK